MSVTIIKCLVYVYCVTAAILMHLDVGTCLFCVIWIWDLSSGFTCESVTKTEKCYCIYYLLRLDSCLRHTGPRLTLELWLASVRVQAMLLHVCVPAAHVGFDIVHMLPTELTCSTCTQAECEDRAVFGRMSAYLWIKCDLRSARSPCHICCDM